MTRGPEKRRRERRKRKRGTRSVPTSMQKRCTRKAKYKTKADAMEAVVGIEARVVHIAGRGLFGPFRAYYCYRCEHWHVGHNRFEKTDKKHGSRQESHSLLDRPEID